MSRTWEACALETHCGSCRTTIAVGAPQQIIRPAVERGIRRRAWVRCEACADGPAPADLPPPILNRSIPIPQTVLLRSGPGTLPFDFKQAAGHDRQPGEDD
jgi:hypothetical protein